MKKTAPAGNRTDLMFRAFSDRTRLRILHLLQGREMCVGDLVSVLRIEQPSASRHLAYLRRAGLVSARKAKNWIYYTLAPAQAPFHQKLLECLACCFGEAPELQADQERAKRVRGAGGCCPGQERAARPAKKPKGDKEDGCYPD